MQTVRLQQAGVLEELAQTRGCGAGRKRACGRDPAYQAPYAQDRRTEAAGHAAGTGARYREGQAVCVVEGERSAEQDIPLQGRYDKLPALDAQVAQSGRRAGNSQNEPGVGKRHHLYRCVPQGKATLAVPVTGHGRLHARDPRMDSP